MKTFNINSIAALLIAALTLFASKAHGQTSDVKVLEKEYNNSGFLYYVKPHPEWSKMSHDNLPEVLSKVYEVNSGWRFELISAQDIRQGTITKLVQTYGQYAVDGADMNIRRLSNGEITDIFGTLRKLPETPQEPLIPQEIAIQAVYQDLEISDFHLDVNPETGEKFLPNVALKYAPIQGQLENTHVLCYKIDVVTKKPARWIYYVNAETGTIENRKFALFHVNGSGSSLYSGNVNFNSTKINANLYHLHDSIRKIKVYDYGYNTLVRDSSQAGCGNSVGPNNIYTDSNNVWDKAHQRAAVDVIWGMSKVYDYYKSKHYRNSFDNQGTLIGNRVNYDEWWTNEKFCPIDSAFWNLRYNNAFWNGRVMSYGQGDGNRFGPLVSLDIVGHEFTHAVVEHTAGLEYQGESGALNEAFADIFGVCIEYYGKPSGNYKMGEECFTPGTGGDALRDIDDPNNSGGGGQPACYEETPHWVDPSDLDDDHGGVHTNSGVANYWFYLLCEGGKDKNQKNDEYDVTKIGRQKAELIAYRALDGYLSSWSDFAQARKATLLAAEDYYGKESDEYKQVCEAWFAVNVGEKCCDSMELSFEIEEPTCADSEDGKIDLKIEGSNGPFEYRWFKGDTTSAVLATSKNISGLKADRYIVIVKDTVAKCEEVADTTLEGETVKVSVTGGGTFRGPCERNIEVTLRSSATGGERPYTYNWNPGGVKRLTLGGRNSSFRSYTAVITDKNGCKGEKTTSVLYIPIRCSYDPNDIIGPPAYGDQNWVSVNATLPYKIRFENDPDFATGPAQRVTIHHDLDSNVNINTFRLGDFGFYKYNFSVPANSNTYSDRLDLRDSFGIFLDVTAGVDIAKRQAFWIFQSIDPKTGLPPTSGDAGFLAVNDTTKKDGEGYVDYNIRPRSDAQTGDSIRAIANIVFDNNPAILTPKIYNLIDAVAPTSSIDSVPPFLDSNSVQLTITAADDPGGCGVGTFDVFYSENNGPYQLYVSDIEDSSFTFSGNYGSAYAFYSRASDNVENEEAAKTLADITFSIAPDEFFKAIPPNTSLCSGDTLNLSWNVSNVTNIDLEYSADSGQSYQTFAQRVGVADTLYRWVIPNSISAARKYFVRAKSSASGTILDSTEVFTLSEGPQPDLGPDTSICDGITFNITLDPGQGFSSYKWNDNSSNASLQVSGFGKYSVEVSNAYGCKASDEINIARDLLPTVMNKSITNPSCFGFNDGQASVMVVSGAAPYKYDWSQGDTTPTARNLSDGRYYLTITDSKGCKGYDSADLNQPAMLMSSVNVTNVKCNGGSDGELNLIVSGGTMPYSFAWSNNDTTEDLSNLTAGTYTVLITDDNNCLLRDTGEVTEPMPLSGGKVVTDVKCHSGSDGSVNLSISGGTQPYTFQWSNNATTEDLSNVAAGTYTVLVTDDNGCTYRDTAIVREPNALSSTLSLTAVNCYGESNGQANLSVSGGTMPYSFAWSNNANSEDINNLTAGTYTVVITDANNCILRDTAVITQPDQLGVTHVITDVKCKGESSGAVNLSVSGGTTPYRFSWSNNATTEDLNNVSAGAYHVLITDDNNCTVRDTVEVDEPDALVGSVLITDVKCKNGNDGAVNLTVAGGTTPYAFSWSNNATTEDISSLSAGTYTVRVTDGNNCILRDTAVVNEPTLLTISASLSHVSCKNGSDGSIDMTISGGTSPYSVQWSNNATTEDVSNLVAGTYSVLVTDANNCALRDTFTINEPDILASTISITQVSCNGGVNGSVNLSVSGGTTPYRFSWSNNATTEDISNLSAGTYTVLITDANNCSLRDTAVVTQPTALSLSHVTTNVKCNGGTDGAVNLSVNGGTTPYTFAWSNNASTEDISNLSAGTYTVLVTDANNCTIRDTADVSQPSALSKANVVTDVKCNGGSDGAVNLTINGGVTPYTFVWSNSASSEDISNLTAGTYSVEVTDANNCVIRDTAVVGQPALMTVSNNISDVNCYNGADGSVDITVGGGVTPYTFLWSNSATTEDISNLSSGTYTLLITDANNCTLRDTAVVNQPGAPLSSVLITDSVTCYNTATGSIDLTVTGGTQPYTFAWNNSATSEDIGSLTDGEYKVLITDANNCTLRDSAMVYEPDTLLPGFVATDVLCFGDATGAIDLSVTGGVMPYQFNWSNGPATEDVASLISGVYAVTITDHNNCITIDSVRIDQPLAPLSSDIAMTAVNCFAGNDGAFDLVVSGGTSPYSFIWSNGPTTEDQTNVSAGEYRVLITDDNNCTLRDTTTVTQPAAPLSSLMIVEDVKCFGGDDGAANLTVNGGTQPYDFAWSDGANQEDISNRPTGRYIVTVTDGNNCVLIDTADIGQPAAPLSSVINAIAVNCFGGDDGTVDLEVSGGTMPYDFSWNNGANTEDLSDLSTGRYIVLVTDANNCTLEDSIDVSQPSAPLSSDIAVTDVLCFAGSDGALDLTVNGGTAPYNFNWSNGSADEDISNLQAGKYVVDVTDANNCLLSDSATVFEPTELLLELDGTSATTDAANGSVWVTAMGGTPPYVFQWNDPESQDNDTAYDLNIGFYRVTVTDANGCQKTDTISVPEAPAPERINLYPNPSAGAITLDNLASLGLDEPITIEIWDMTPKLQMQFEVLGQDILTFEVIEQLYNGAYMVKIFNKRGVQYRKLLLVR